MDIVRQSLAISFVFALLWLALWLLRRKGALNFRLPRGGQETKLLESRARLSLSAQHSIHVLRIGEREVAVAVHPAGVTLLCDVAENARAAKGSAA
jgi:flagellar biogenesis protein FliO